MLVSCKRCCFSFGSDDKIRSWHLIQVYTFTAIACMRYTSRTAWRLCYSPPNHDGKLLSCFCGCDLPPPPLPAKFHILHTFLLSCSQKISKKLQYIGATLFMAASLGILSLSYWAQVILKSCFISNCLPKTHSIPQTSNFEPTVLPQVGLVIGSLGLTLFYGMGGLSLLHSMHCISYCLDFWVLLTDKKKCHQFCWIVQCPGMGSVSYAMPGELLSPEDKVSICSHFYLFIESKDNSLQRQLGSILLSVWGCWVLQEYWRWQRDQEQLLYRVFFLTGHPPENVSKLAPPKNASTGPPLNLVSMRITLRSSDT